MWILLLLATVQLCQSNIVPSMQWINCPFEAYQYCLEVDFHDGHPQDVALLRNYS